MHTPNLGFHEVFTEQQNKKPDMIFQPGTCNLQPVTFNLNQ
jgi:hypothetical protein